MQDLALKYKDKNILVWGLGISGGGVGVAEFFAKLGANVKVTDLKPRTELEDSLQQLQGYDNITYSLGEHKDEDFLSADLVIRNPAIPPRAQQLKLCQDNKIPVEMELSLFLQYCRGKTIGITGTRGKSTTTAILTDILKAAGYKVTTGGNNKLPLLLQLDDIDEETYVVIEMSSFQLSGTTASPDVAIVTNIYPDHLNWHPDMDDYVKSKVNIVRFQDENGVACLNQDNDVVVREFSPQGKGKRLMYGKQGGVMIGEEAVTYQGEEVLRYQELKLKGEHNKYNFAAATAGALAVGCPMNSIRQVGKEFAGLPYRQELVAEKDGVKFINDSTSTMPQGTIACIDRFAEEKDKDMHLILGGVDKELDISELVKKVVDNVATVHLFVGNFYDKFMQQISDEYKQFVFGPFHDMQSAIDSAKQQAKSGDYVVLSPAAASFNLFKNEWDRGDQFTEISKV